MERDAWNTQPSITAPSKPRLAKRFEPSMICDKGYRTACRNKQKPPFGKLCFANTATPRIECARVHSSG
jgi:hypothetical protein